jgi:hypothetical protein
MDKTGKNEPLVTPVKGMNFLEFATEGNYAAPLKKMIIISKKR